MIRSLSTVFCFALVSQLPTAAETPVFFGDVQVFDGEKLIRSTNVLVREGLISAIGPDVQPTDASQTIKGDGKTLVPGLIDCHTHTFSESHQVQAALFGVTTELDMMSHPSMAATMRLGRDDAASNPGRADLYSAGAAVTVAGGHGTQFGFPVPTLDDASKTSLFVRSRIREGSDFVKLIIEDGSAYGFTRPTLDRDMVIAAAKTAKEFDRLAVAHVSTLQAAGLAADAKVDGLVHLFCEVESTPELATKLKEQGMFVVPTASVVSNVAGSNSTNIISERESIRPLLTHANLTNLKAAFPANPNNRTSWDRLKTNIAALHEKGVPILAGTDAPNPGTVHGASLHHELHLLVSAGLSPIDAIRSATSLPAKCFKLADRGRIAVGLRADLVLVHGDPTTDIHKLSDIVGVWKNGYPIDRDSRITQVATENAPLSATNDHMNGEKPIGTFDGEAVTAEFGVGWSPSTDSIMGGKSTVSFEIVKGGADDSISSLKVSGTTQEKPPAFSGVMFSPGEIPMQASDLSSHKALSFWARGPEGDKRVMVFTKKRGYQPSIQTFSTSAKWQQYRFAFSDFDGSDGTDVMGIWFGNDQPGEFEFQIDEVSLLND